MKEIIIDGHPSSELIKKGLDRYTHYYIQEGDHEKTALQLMRELAGILTVAEEIGGIEAFKSIKAMQESGQLEQLQELLRSGMKSAVEKLMKDFGEDT